MDHESSEQDSSIPHTLAPHPHPHYLYPNASPAPSSLHRHVSPAPSSYSTHNPPAPRLTPHPAPVEDDADIDAAFDLDSLPDLPAADDTDTDGTWTPRPRRASRTTRPRRQTRRPAPATPLHPSSNARVSKRRPTLASSTSRTGRTSNSNPTFPCTFAWAGCTSAFGSKNEWKRHVATKHICSFYWECKIGSCSALDRKSVV